ncbi:MAG: ABC transporter ATP-binding protein [Halobacteriota archaeon]
MPTSATATPVDGVVIVVDGRVFLLRPGSDGGETELYIENDEEIGDLRDEVEKLEEHAEEAKEQVGHIPGDFQFYEGPTGREILEYFARIRGQTRRDELLERFSVPLDRAVRTYSRGNRQKLAIVQAFMHDPRLVVMDEPTSGLDPLVQQEFYDFLHEERRRGVTVFFSTHILSEVRQVCDRVAIIREGKLVTVEDIETLLERSGKVVTISTEEPVDPSAFDFEGVIDASMTDETLRLVISGNYDTLIDALERYHVTDLEVRQTAIEDVFMHFYGGDDE